MATLRPNVNLRDFIQKIVNKIHANKSSITTINAQDIPNVIDLQSKTVTLSESSQTISPDNLYYGLSSVEVPGISTTYVGSGISRRDSLDTSLNNRLLSVVAQEGYYESGAHVDINPESLGLNGVTAFTITDATTGLEISIPTNRYTYQKVSYTLSYKTPIVDTTNSESDSSHYELEPGQYVHVKSGYYKSNYQYHAKPNPTATYTVSSAVTNADVLNYRYVTVPAGSCKVNAATKSSVSTSLSGTTLTVEADVSPTVSAGWVSGGTGGRIKIQGTVPTETKTITQNGTHNATSGKLMSSVTVNIDSSLKTHTTYVQSLNINRSIYTLTCQSQLYLSNSVGGYRLLGQIYCHYSGTGEDGDDDFDTPMLPSEGYLDGNLISTILKTSGSAIRIGSLAYPADTSGNLGTTIEIYLIRKDNYIYIGTPSSYLYRIPNGSGTAPYTRILGTLDKIISCTSFYANPYIQGIYNSITLAGGTVSVSFAVAFSFYSNRTRGRTLMYTGDTPSIGSSIDHFTVYYDSNNKSLGFTHN